MFITKNISIPVGPSSLRDLKVLLKDRGAEVAVRDEASFRRSKINRVSGKGFVSIESQSKPAEFSTSTAKAHHTPKTEDSSLAPSTTESSTQTEGKKGNEVGPIQGRRATAQMFGGYPQEAPKAGTTRQARRFPFPIIVPEEPKLPEFLIEVTPYLVILTNIANIVVALANDVNVKQTPKILSAMQARTTTTRVVQTPTASSWLNSAILAKIRSVLQSYKHSPQVKSDPRTAEEWGASLYFRGIKLENGLVFGYVKRCWRGKKWRINLCYRY